MLKIQEVVNFVNDKLNELGTESGYSFDIHSNIGENRNNGAINGILYTNSANSIPIPNYTENDYVFVVELLVPAARVNYNVEQIQHIIENFDKTYNGSQQTFDGGKALLNITPSKPENFNIGYNAGENVPLYFTISVLYTETATTSGDAHWFLDGFEIPYLNEEILFDREANVNKQYGAGYPFSSAETKALLTSQTVMFRFVFPYATPFPSGFLADLMSADLEREYELKYYDGQIYTQQYPYKTTVKVYKSARLSGQRGKAKNYDITFTKVDNGLGTTKYFMALIDNPFDNQTEDTMWFEAVVEDGEVTKTAQEVQQEYFESKVADGCRYEQIKAPNLNSIDITSQIYPNRYGYDLFDTTNKNYAIIKVQTGQYDDSQVFVPITTRYFYYYATNQHIGAGNQILFDLKLDTFQTYMFDPDIKFSDCFIEKANLNRWVQVDANTVAFNGEVTSDLFEQEELKNIAKRLVNRQKQNINTFFTKANSSNAPVDTWLNNNVVAWVYAFIEMNHDYSIKQKSSNANDTKNLADYPLYIYGKNIENSAHNTGLACICYPLYVNENVDIGSSTHNTKNQIIIEDNTNINEYVVLNSSGFQHFLEANNDYSYVVGVKISIVPPFANKKDDAGTIADWRTQTSGGHTELIFTSNATTEFRIIGNQPILPTNTVNYEVVSGVTMCWQEGVYVCCLQDCALDFSWNGSYQTTFAKASIIGSNKNVAYNPKLLAQQYHSIKITNQDADGYEYDLQKLGTNNLTFAYSEPLTPDISRSYIRLKNATGLYTEGTTENFTGTVSTNDNSLIRVTDAYKSMLAQQKNFYQQNSINREINMWQGFGTAALGGLGGLALGGVLGAATVVGTALTGVNAIINNEKSIMNENFAVDNLKNAPSSIQNAKGNVFLNAMATKLGVYVEEWDVLPYEKEMANDFMIKYGFTVNKFGNLMDYFKIRHYFNFVKAQVATISGIPLSNVARADLRQRIANGVRCWKKNNGEFAVNYTKENYEEWINATDSNGNKYTSYNAWLADQ